MRITYAGVNRKSTHIYIYGVNYNHGSVNFNKGKVTVYPENGSCFEPELNTADGYYKKICYLLHGYIIRDKPTTRCPQECTRDTIAIALAES